MNKEDGSYKKHDTIDGFRNNYVDDIALDKEGMVKLDVFNVTGQKVTSLLQNHLSAGTHTVQWNGRDTYGMEMSSGVYFLRLFMGEKSATHRTMLVK